MYQSSIATSLIIIFLALSESGSYLLEAESFCEKQNQDVFNSSSNFKCDKANPKGIMEIPPKLNENRRFWRMESRRTSGNRQVPSRFTENNRGKYEELAQERLSRIFPSGNPNGASRLLSIRRVNLRNTWPEKSSFITKYDRKTDRENQRQRQMGRDLRQNERSFRGQDLRQREPINGAESREERKLRKVVPPMDNRREISRIRDDFERKTDLNRMSRGERKLNRQQLPERENSIVSKDLRNLEARRGTNRRSEAKFQASNVQNSRLHSKQRERNDESRLIKGTRENERQVLRLATNDRRSITQTTRRERKSDVTRMIGEKQQQSERFNRQGLDGEMRTRETRTMNLKLVRDKLQTSEMGVGSRRNLEGRGNSIKQSPQRETRQTEETRESSKKEELTSRRTQNNLRLTPEASNNMRESRLSPGNRAVDLRQNKETRSSSYVQQSSSLQGVRRSLAREERRVSRDSAQGRSRETNRRQTILDQENLKDETRRSTENRQIRKVISRLFVNNRRFALQASKMQRDSSRNKCNSSLRECSGKENVALREIRFDEETRRFHRTLKIARMTIDFDGKLKIREDTRRTIIKPGLEERNARVRSSDELRNTRNIETQLMSELSSRGTRLIKQTGEIINREQKQFRNIEARLSGPFNTDTNDFQPPAVSAWYITVQGSLCAALFIQQFYLNTKNKNQK